MPTCGKHSTVLSSNHHHHCIGSVLVYFNPVTGSQYEREVVFNFLCDPEVDGVETLCARQNSTNDCHYSVLFKTSKACAGDGHVSLLRRAKDWVAGLFV